MKKNTMLISAAVLSMALGITGAYAYYTAQTKTVENTFNIVAGGGESGDAVGTVEEVFDPISAKDLEPRATFKKDVKIDSNVDYSSHAYLFVTVPNINARLKDQTAKEYQDAVTLDINTLNWELVKSTKGDGSTPSKYLYRYKSVLAADAATESLFTTATVPDFVECEALAGTIDVTGYMISSTNVSAADADADAIANYFK